MNRLIRTALASLVASATVAAGTFGAGVAHAADPRPATAGLFDAGLARQHDQLVAIEHFRAVAEADPDRFAGISTQGPDRVTVNLAPVTPAADLSAIRREAATVGITVSVRVQQHSTRELTRIRDAVTHDTDLATAAAGPVSASIDPDTNSVKITTTSATAALRARAHDRFGDAVTVSTVGVIKNVLGRFNDSSPYWGGDRIGTPSGYCTSGFSLTNLYGTRYAITAGHCWSVIPTTVSVTRQYGGRDNLGAGYDIFGTVQLRRYGGGNLDNELIGGKSYGGAIWVGNDLANDSDMYAPVHDAHASCLGCNVYFDGSFTGKRLATVKGNQDCINFEVNGVYDESCGLWWAQSTDDNPICKGGDSGGPVFAYDGRGGVTAVGIITAMANKGKDCFYTDITQILSYWQSTITTG